MNFVHMTVALPAKGISMIPLLSGHCEGGKRISAKIYVFKDAIIGPNSR
jgi:hypothetical protein